jgi:hypothetical protein
MLRRHTAERIERGHQHGHGQRHGDGERQRQHEKLANGGPGQAFAGKIGELARDVLQHEQRRQGRQGEHEGAHVLADDIAGKELHDVNSQFTTRFIKGATPRMLA